MLKFKKKKKKLGQVINIKFIIFYYLNQFLKFFFFLILIYLNQFLIVYNEILYLYFFFLNKFL